jgi:hypothetical protein
MSIEDTASVSLNETAPGSGIFSGYFIAGSVPGDTSPEAPSVVMTDTSILEAWYAEPGLAPLLWPTLNARMPANTSADTPQAHSATLSAGDRLTITVPHPCP